MTDTVALLLLPDGRHREPSLRRRLRRRTRRSRAGWRIRRRWFVADAQEAREAGQAVGGEAAVAVGHPAAGRGWILALRIGEAAADAETAAVRRAHQQRAHASGVAAFARHVAKHLRLGVLVWL